MLHRRRFVAWHAGIAILLSSSQIALAGNPVQAERGVGERLNALINGGRLKEAIKAGEDDLKARGLSVEVLRKAGRPDVDCSVLDVLWALGLALHGADSDGRMGGASEVGRRSLEAVDAFLVQDGARGSVQECPKVAIAPVNPCWTSPGGCLVLLEAALDALGGEPKEVQRKVPLLARVFPKFGSVRERDGSRWLAVCDTQLEPDRLYVVRWGAGTRRQWEVSLARPEWGAWHVYVGELRPNAGIEVCVEYSLRRSLDDAAAAKREEREYVGVRLFRVEGDRLREVVPLTDRRKVDGLVLEPAR